MELQPRDQGPGYFPRARANTTNANPFQVNGSRKRSFGCLELGSRTAFEVRCPVGSVISVWLSLARPPQAEQAAFPPCGWRTGPRHESFLQAPPPKARAKAQRHGNTAGTKEGRTRAGQGGLPPNPTCCSTKCHAGIKMGVNPKGGSPSCSAVSFLL